MENKRMNDLLSMIWVELLKAIRSRMPLWTALGSLLMPLGIAFLIFVSRNPEISQQLGLVSAKANLMAFSGTDWPTYLGVYAQIVGAGGLILFILILSWIFGREFADGTLKDMLAVPVQRGSIVLAKYVVSAIWCETMVLVIFIAGMVMGVILKLPGNPTAVFLEGIALMLKASVLVFAAVTPFAFFASIGRGYLLPIGVAMLMMIAVNLIVILGRGEYFPWSVPMIYAQGKEALMPVSFWIVFLTGLLGVLGTYLWWKYADQNR
jgi:ABC-2 type transport system permease protein